MRVAADSLDREAVKREAASSPGSAQLRLLLSDHLAAAPQQVVEAQDHPKEKAKKYFSPRRGFNFAFGGILPTFRADFSIFASRKYTGALRVQREGGGDLHPWRTSGLDGLEIEGLRPTLLLVLWSRGTKEVTTLREILTLASAISLSVFVVEKVDSQKSPNKPYTIHESLTVCAPNIIHHK